MAEADDGTAMVSCNEAEVPRAFRRAHAVRRHNGLGAPNRKKQQGLAFKKSDLFDEITALEERQSNKKIVGPRRSTLQEPPSAAVLCQQSTRIGLQKTWRAQEIMMSLAAQPKCNPTAMNILLNLKNLGY